MSNKSQPRSELRVFVPLDKTDKWSISAKSQRLSPPGPTSSYTYNNQYKSEHNRSAKVKVIPDGNYRRPAPYRVFALKVTAKEFNMVYNVGLNSSRFGAWGTSDHASGFGAPFYGYLGTSLSGGLRVPDVSQNRQNQVIAEAKSKLQNGDLNLLTSLAEAKEAMSFAASALKSIADLMRRFLSSERNHRVLVDSVIRYRYQETYDFVQILPSGERLVTPRTRTRTGKSKRFKELSDARSFAEKADAVLSDAEKAWLSTMYGMLPLIQDYLGFIAAARKKLAEKGSHITVLRSIKWPRDFPGAPAGYPQWSWEGEWHSGCECQLSYRISNPHLSYLSSLGLDNPLSVFWEVTPYSFVVDWLIPIGNWLRSLTADVGMDFLDGFVNTKNVLDATLTSANYASARGILPSVHYKSVCQFRYTLVTSPLPGLYIKSPFTSTTRAVSAIALAAQALR